jgi:hypothetical protein
MQVKAPLFFMLGAKDRRVPLDDAKQYINALRRVLLRGRSLELQNHCPQSCSMLAAWQAFCWHAYLSTAWPPYPLYSVQAAQGCT